MTSLIASPCRRRRDLEIVEQSNLGGKYNPPPKKKTSSRRRSNNVQELSFGLVGPGHEMICNYSLGPAFGPPQLPHWRLVSHDTQKWDGGKIRGESQGGTEEMMEVRRQPRQIKNSKRENVKGSCSESDRLLTSMQVNIITNESTAVIYSNRLCSAPCGWAPSDLLPVRTSWKF